jgi:hypothetical protein
MRKNLQFISKFLIKIGTLNNCFRFSGVYKIALTLNIVLLVAKYSYGQCGPYQVYEGFGSQSLPIQGGTWSANGIIQTRTSIARSGDNAITFNSSGDYIATPLIDSPKEFSFWFKGSTNTNASSFAVETSSNGTTWTPRGTISSNVSTYTNYTIDLAALGLTNIYVRIRDSRGSGTFDRYVDDVSWTSTNMVKNIILIQSTSPCNFQLSTGVSLYKLYDIGGDFESYINNQSSNPITLIPPIGYNVLINFFQILTEPNFDVITLYNGKSINDPILYTGSGSKLITYPINPVTIFRSSDSSGALTLGLTTNNTTVWEGFFAVVKIEPTIPKITSVTSSINCGNSTKVVITGTYLNNLNTASIGSLNLLPFDSVSHNRVVKFMSTPFNGKVYVSNNFGSDSSSNTILFINPPPLTIDSPSITICNGASTIIKVTSNTSDFTSYSWTPSAGVTGSTTAIFNPTSTTAYTLNAINSNTGCINSLTRTVVVDTSYNMPSPISITQGNSTPLCFGGIDSLEVLGGIIPLSNATLFEEKANLLPSSFNLVNMSGTGSISLNNTYFREGTGSIYFNSTTNWANLSYETNSNLNLVGSDSAILSWSHIAGLEGEVLSFDLGYVEYSTDGGANWTTFPNSSYRGLGSLITTQSASTPVSGVIFSTLSYIDWTAKFTATTSTPGIGTATSLWKDETILIPLSALSSSRFKIRFRYKTDNSNIYYGWLIDNIKIKRYYSKATFKWTPTSTLFNNNTASILYTDSSMKKVFTKSKYTQKYYLTVFNGTCFRKDSITDSVKSANANLFLANTSIIGAVEQCTDFDGWSYYAEPNDPNKWLFGIYKNGHNFSATVDLNVDTLNKHHKKTSSNGANQEHASYNLSRYWNVNATGSLGNGVKIRFLINPQDITSLINIRDADYNQLKNITNPNTLAVKSNFEWYKTIGIPYNPSNWIGNSHNSPIEKLNEDKTEVINGITCVDLSGITSFSGGTGGAAFGPNNSSVIGLPVSWLYAKANAKENGNWIEWATASEINSNYFDVEFSYDGKSFQKINNQKILASGNSSSEKRYSWLHIGAFNEEIYYRIKLTDLDYKESYSNIVQLKRIGADDSPQINLFPIPIQNETLNINIQTSKNSLFYVSISNLMGQIVYNSTFSNIAPLSSHQINVDFLPKGVYAIEIQNNELCFKKNIRFLK